MSDWGFSVPDVKEQKMTWDLHLPLRTVKGGRLVINVMSSRDRASFFFAW